MINNGYIDITIYGVTNIFSFLYLNNNDNDNFNNEQ